MSLLFFDSFEDGTTNKWGNAPNLNHADPVSYLQVNANNAVDGYYSLLARNAIVICTVPASSRNIWSFLFWHQYFSGAASTYPLTIARARDVNGIELFRLVINVGGSVSLVCSLNNQIAATVVPNPGYNQYEIVWNRVAGTLGLSINSAAGVTYSYNYIPSYSPTSFNIGAIESTYDGSNSQYAIFDYVTINDIATRAFTYTTPVLTTPTDGTVFTGSSPTQYIQWTASSDPNPSYVVTVTDNVTGIVNTTYPPFPNYTYTNAVVPRSGNSLTIKLYTSYSSGQTTTLTSVNVTAPPVLTNSSVSASLQYTASATLRNLAIYLKATLLSTAVLAQGRFYKVLLSAQQLLTAARSPTWFYLKNISTGIVHTPTVGVAKAYFKALQAVWQHTANIPTHPYAHVFQYIVSSIPGLVQVSARSRTFTYKAITTLQLQKPALFHKALGSPVWLATASLAEGRRYALAMTAAWIQAASVAHPRVLSVILSPVLRLTPLIATKATRYLTLTTNLLLAPSIGRRYIIHFFDALGLHDSTPRPGFLPFVRKSVIVHTAMRKILVRGPRQN